MVVGCGNMTEEKICLFRDGTPCVKEKCYAYIPRCDPPPRDESDIRAYPEMAQEEDCRLIKYYPERGGFLAAMFGKK